MTDRVSVQKWFIITYTTYNDWYMIDCHLKIKTTNPLSLHRQGIQYRRIFL